METPRRRTDIPTFPAGMRLEIERSKCRCIRTNGAVASTEHVGTRISLQVVMTGPTDDLVSTAAAQCALAARGDQVLLLGGLGGLLLLIEEPELHLSPYGSRHAGRERRTGAVRREGGFVRRFRAGSRPAFSDLSAARRGRKCGMESDVARHSAAILISIGGWRERCAGRRAFSVLLSAAWRNSDSAESGSS
jgi:hypothetical protein